MSEHADDIPDEEVARMVLDAVKAVAKAIDPRLDFTEPKSLPEISKYCPPELRWDYTGR